MRSSTPVFGVLDGRHNPPTQATGSTMPHTAQLLRFVEDELSRSAALAEENAELTLAQIKQPREGMLSQSDREHFFELTQALPQHKSDFALAFTQALRSVVKAELQGIDLAGPAPAAQGSRGLELMDESRVEVDIEISGAAQIIAGSAEWELRELQTFTSTLAGQQHVSADTNPMRPLAYARALWEATGVVTQVGAQRAILLRTASGVMSGQLKKAWAAACTRLESQGVEPGIYRTVVLATGAAVSRPPRFDLTRPGALENLLSNMPGAAGPSGTPPASSASPPAASGPQVRLVGEMNPAFEQALAKIEGVLQQPKGRGTAQLTEHRADLLANAPETVNRQIVELLSRLFEAVLSDSRLPPAFRTVVARLQVSALRVALVDPTMVEQHEHPVWRLMNRIGSVCETYTQTTDPRWVALLAYCEALVDDMSRAPVQDAVLYKLSLSRLDAFLAEQFREQQLRAQPTADALERLEKRDEMERQISQRLTEQMVPIRTTPGIRRFVTGTWAKVIAESMQRYGEKGEATLEYLRATDDLLWSLHPPDHPQSRKRLLGMLPQLLPRIRAGMALVGIPDPDQQPVLDELMQVHTEALRPGKAVPPAEDLTPQQIVQRMRDEESWSPPSRPPFSESLIDLSSMETVPADVLPDAPGSHDEATQRIEALAVGSRHNAFIQGRWKRVQLLWRSPRGQFFLFAGPDPTHPVSITRRALERLSEESLIKPLDDHTLVQRAVDSLTRKLEIPA